MACGVFHLHSVVLNTGHGAVIAERSAPGVLTGISLSVVSPLRWWEHRLSGLWQGMLPHAPCSWPGVLTHLQKGFDQHKTQLLGSHVLPGSLPGLSAVSGLPGIYFLKTLLSFTTVLNTFAFKNLFIKSK